MSMPWLRVLECELDTKYRSFNGSPSFPFQSRLAPEGMDQRRETRVPLFS